MPSPILPMSQGAFTAHNYVQVIRRFVAHLAEHESLLNDLNVFPVPDGDTGTNSLLTVSKCAEVSAAAESDLARVAQDVANVASDQARGNSGVILSEYLRGLADALVESPTNEQWQSALSSAAQVARASVSHPRTGTILTVADQVASVSMNHGNLADYFVTISQCAREAVQATTGQLPELRAAGVVDAGALALSLFFDSLAAEASGHEMPALELDVRTCVLDQVSYDGPSHEVMFRFEGSDSDVAALRVSLDGLGDSITISGQHPPYLVHVHVDDPDEAVRAGMLLGRVQRITVSRLLEDEDERDAQDAVPTDRANRLGVVVVCHGAVMAGVLQGLGAQPIVALPRSEPATWEIRDAIERTRATRVIILPSDPDCLGSAQLAARDAARLGIETEVVPTTSIVQSLAACSVFDSEATLAEAVSTLTSVASNVRHGAVTLADRHATTPVGACQKGDVLGVVDGQVRYIASDGDMVGMLGRVVNELASESAERLTVVEGHGVLDDYQSILRHRYPDLELDVISGGQLLWPYIVGVE